MNSLRSRMEEKELILAHKEEQLNSMSTDKSKRSGEVNELKEIIDLKERKVAVLQKKVSHRFYAMCFMYLLFNFFLFIKQDSLLCHRKPRRAMEICKYNSQFLKGHLISH